MYIPKISKHIQTGYDRKSLRELKKLDLSVKISDRRIVNGITLDSVHSKDLDDGIWAKKIDSGYEIEVSIADIAQIIKPFTHLDNEAFKRATSVYLNTHVVHMFPEEISTDFSSLNGNKNSYAITIKIKLNKSFEVIYVDLYESIFYNKFRFDYEEFNSQFLNIYSEYHNDFYLFLNIAKGLYSNRIRKGGLRFFKDDDRTIEIYNSIKENNGASHLASFIIQEFMILANNQIAKFMHENGIPGIFRNHMPDNKNHEQIDDIERAFYSNNMQYHFALALDYYCHFSSPIRRYADLISHRQIKSFLNNQEYIYTKNDLKTYCLYINEQIFQLKTLQKDLYKSTRNKIGIRKIKRFVLGDKVDLSDVPIHMFEKLLYYYLFNENNLSKCFIDEIMYRLNSDLLSNHSLFVLLMSNNMEYKKAAVKKIKERTLYKSFLNYIKINNKIKVEEVSKCDHDNNYFYSLNILLGETLLFHSETTGVSKNGVKRIVLIDIMNFFSTQKVNLIKEDKNIEGIFGRIFLPFYLKKLEKVINLIESRFFRNY